MPKPSRDAETIKSIHEEVLYTTVRVHTEKAGGSGTVIYSAKNLVEEWETYVLTNHHVVADALEIKEEWDPFLQRKVNKEVRNTVTVARFRYENESNCVGVEELQGDVVAWDKDEDLALVKVRLKDSGWANVAKLLPYEDEAKIRMCQPIRACGCALLHEPFSNLGEITGLNDEIDNRRYFMGSTLITFGNSGGAVFSVPDHKFIGIPSRVAIQGFASPANFMGYFIPPSRWYAFLRKHYYSFIWTGEDPAKCHKQRARRLQRADVALNVLREGLVEDQDLSGGQKPDDDYYDPPEYGPRAGLTLFGNE